MRKIKEILRLHFEQKLGQRQIASSVNTSQSTVHEYLARMEAAGLHWPLGANWNEERLEQALFPPGQTPAKIPNGAYSPTSAAFATNKLEKHRDLTLELLWEEYREQHPDGYSYSRFCKLYREWKKEQDVVLRQEHRPGEKLFLDWAGATIPIHLPDGTTRPGGRCSLPRWAPPAIPMPKPSTINRWRTGSKCRCMRSSFMAVLRNC